MVEANRLFARLYADEDVSAVLVRMLRSRGFDVATVSQAGLSGREDERQLDCAARQGRVLLTHNKKHFAQLDEQWRRQGRKHAGMILLKRRRDCREMARRILVLLNEFTPEEFAGQVHYA